MGRECVSGRRRGKGGVVAETDDVAARRDPQRVATRVGPDVRCSLWRKAINHKVTFVPLRAGGTVPRKMRES